MPAKISYKITHAKIQRRIQAGTRMDASHWQSKPSLSRLYWRVHRDKAGGGIFRGNDTWYGYLEREHGISSLDAMAGTYRQKDILKLKETIESGREIDFDEWKKEPELIGLFYRLKRKSRDGVIFEGHHTFARFAASNPEIRGAMSKRIRNAIKSCAATQKGKPVGLKQLADKAGISAETIVSFVRAAPASAIILRNLRPERYSCVFDPFDRVQAIETVHSEIERARRALNPGAPNRKISRLNRILEKMYHGGNLGVIECG